MAKWQISFEIDLPTDKKEQAAEWASFVVGSQAHLKGDNPCRNVDLPAGDRIVSTPRVYRTE